MNSDLGRRAIKSTAWFGATRLCIQMGSWASTLVIARLLSPEDYGLFGMALSVMNILQMTQELGLGTALVQRKDLKTGQINGVFWVVVGSSLVLASVGYLAAVPVAFYYGERKLVPIVRTLAASFVISAVGTVPYSLLTREIDFRQRSLAEAYGTISSIAVLLSLAFSGYGVWALVLGNVVQSLVRNGAMLIYSGWRPNFEAEFDGVGTMIKFGVKVAGGSLLGRAYTAANPLIIGKLLGQGALGIFTMADSLGSNNPLNKISVAVLNQLSLPMFSKLQDDVPQLKTSFLRITKYLAFIAFPTQVGTAIVARDLITVMLTGKWAAAIALVQVFCVSGLFYVIPLPCGPLLVARGKAGAALKNSIVSTVTMMVAILVGSMFNLGAVSICWLVVFPFARLLLLRLSLQELNIAPKEYIATIVKPCLATLGMAAIIVLVRYIAYPDSQASVRLCRDILVGAVGYISLVCVIDKQLTQDLIWAMTTLIAKEGRVAL